MLHCVVVPRHHCWIGEIGGSARRNGTKIELKRGTTAVNLATASDNEETEVHETVTTQAAGMETRITLGATMK